jgi:tetratricopeptide (TPR) repeat protein
MGLNENPSSNNYVPSTLDDFMALLQDNQTMNRSPAIGDISSDNFYLLPTFWLMLPVVQKNAYIWAPDIFEGQTEVEEWKAPYTKVLNANVILDGLYKINVTGSNNRKWHEIRGAALFARAHAFYQLAQLFAPYYDTLSSIQPFGIPLRLTVSKDIVQRSTLTQTYDRILTDLLEAASLLGPFTDQHVNLASRPAAYALLARVYLSMDNYGQALFYSDKCLRTDSVLINYDTLNVNSINVFRGHNPEIIFHSEFYAAAVPMKGVVAAGAIIDSVLYRSYDSNDLRQKAFFLINAAGNPNLKYGYAGTIYQFSGIATDEVWLIRAECHTRLGHTTQALYDLNTLLRHRWKAGTYTPVQEFDPQKLLALILDHRRKELPFRGLRWTDLRRFNKEGKTRPLIRKLDNNSYSLEPGNIRYTLPIPNDIIGMTGMLQNPR